MNFATQFDKHDRVFCCPGDRYVKQYKPIIDTNGHYELEEDPNQVKDLYLEIQSHKDSVDIHYLVERFRAGDVDVLSRVQGFYGDLTTVPKNIFEYMNLRERCNGYFDSLPPNIKQRFDNSPVQFALSAGSKEWFDKIGFSETQITGIVKESEDKVE